MGGGVTRPLKRKISPYFFSFFRPLTRRGLTNATFRPRTGYHLVIIYYYIIYIECDCSDHFGHHLIASKDINLDHSPDERTSLGACKWSHIDTSKTASKVVVSLQKSFQTH